MALVVERAEPREAPALETLASWGERWLERRATRVRWPAQDRSRRRLYVAPSALAA